MTIATGSRRGLAAVLVFALLASCAHAVYFYVNENGENCFLQEVPEDTAVQGSYANLDIDSLGVGSDGQPTLITLTVTDPDNQVIISHDAKRKGVVAWTSVKEGEHTICVSVQNGSRNGRKFRFGLTFKQGKAEADYGTMAKQEHLSAIIVEIRKLSDRVLARQQEQDYQKHLEEKFRDESENMNSRVGELLNDA